MGLSSVPYMLSHFEVPQTVLHGSFAGFVVRALATVLLWMQVAPHSHNSGCILCRALKPGPYATEHMECD